MTGAESPTDPRTGELYFPVPETKERVLIVAVIAHVRHVKTLTGMVQKGQLLCEGEYGRFKLWGTIPIAIIREIEEMNTVENWTVQGSLVSFWARVKRGTKNDYSGFFSRASKVRVLTPGRNGKEVVR